MISRIGEICIHTDDVIKLADFYRWLLGIEEVNQDDVHQFILRENTVFTVYNDGTQKKKLTNNFSLAFDVDDVDFEYERLLKNKVVIIEKPTMRPWGAKNLHFLDPDGNHIYFRSFPTKKAE